MLYEGVSSVGAIHGQACSLWIGLSGLMKAVTLHILQHVLSTSLYVLEVKYAHAPARALFKRAKCKGVLPPQPEWAILLFRKKGGPQLFSGCQEIAVLS